MTADLETDLAAQTRWLNPQEQAAWRAYLDGTRVLLQALDRQLIAGSGLSLTDYEVLVRLSEAPGGRLRMGELAGATLATPSGITRAVTRAERAGWVVRVECEDDRRGTLAELTEVGRGVLAAGAPGHVAAVRAGLFDALSPAQVAQLQRLGTAILAAAVGTTRSSTVTSPPMGQHDHE